MPNILTLCPVCRKDLENAFFRVKPAPGATTAKKQICENCGRRYASELKQYLVSAKR